MKTRSHFEWIDILRGFSALAVVLFHVRVDLWVGWRAIQSDPNAFTIFDRAVALLSLPVSFGGSAVMLFFIISGFCVHYPQAAGRRLELKSYGVRRFMRVYPPYVAVIILCIMIEWVLRHYFGQRTSAPSTILKSVFMVQNYGENAGQMISNPSLWSLPVELELYLIYPLFYLLLNQLGIKKSLVIVGVISSSALVFSLLDRKSTTFDLAGNFAVYWIIWCSGAVLAEWAKRQQMPRWRTSFTVVLICSFCFALLGSLLKFSLSPLNWVWALFYFMVMLWGLSRDEPLRKVAPDLRKLLVTVGLMSYSLYLVHFPFFALCGAIWVEKFGVKPSNFLITLFFAFLSLPVAYIFYLTVEAPSHRLARRFKDKSEKEAVPVPIPQTGM